MIQINRLTLGAITYLAALGIVLSGTYVVATSSENPPNHNSKAGNVFVKVISGEDKPVNGQQPAEAWIIQETTKSGSPHAWEHTNWIEVAENKQEIYSSMRGGRLIETRLVPDEKPGQVTVEITGFKIGTVPRRVMLRDQDDIRQVIKITDYPGAGNVFLAFQFGEGSSQQHSD